MSENQLAERRSAMDEIDTQIADGRTELQRFESEIAGHQNRIQVNRQRADELTELIERFRKDIAVAKAKRVQQEKELQDANALIEKTNEVLQGKETELAKLTALISRSEERRVGKECRSRW